MSGIITVTAKKNEAEGSLEYDFGENLEEMVTLFGEGIVHSNARAQMKVGLQAAMRRRLEAGQPIDDLITYKPGVQIERNVDSVAAVKAKMSTMSSEEREALLEDLRTMV